MPGRVRILGLALLLAAPVPAADAGSLPPLFKVAREARVGFISANGSLVVRPRYAGCGPRWSAGHLWVVSSLDDEYSGNFINSRGRELLGQPAAVYLDDVMGLVPEFDHGRAVIGNPAGGWSVVSTNGILAAGLDSRTAGIFPVERDGRVGYADWSGHEILSPRFEAGRPFRGDCAPVRQDGQWGLIARDGSWILPPTCSGIEAGENGYWIATQDGRIGLLRPEGAWLHPPAFQALGAWGPWAVAVQEKEAWFVLDLATGQRAFSAGADEIPAIGASSVWARVDGQYGLRGTDGSLLQPFQFDSVLRAATAGERWLVCKGDTEGLIGADGTILLPCNFHSILPLSDDLFLVRTEDSAGLYDVARSRWALPPAYEEVAVWDDFPGRGAAVAAGGLWGWIDLAETRLRLPIEYRELHPWNRLIEARKGTYCALYTLQGNPVLPWSAGITQLPDPDLGLINGCGKILKENQAGLIDSQGVVQLPCRFQDVGIVSEGLVPVRENDLWGYVDLKGEWIIPPQYSRALPFSEGLAAVQQEGRYGCIDRSGTTRIPFRYAAASQAFGGRVPVAVKNPDGLRWGLSDTEGNIILPLEYEALEWIGPDPAQTCILGSVTWHQF